jgi:hypothetical protein
MLLFGLIEKFGTEAPYIGIGGDVLFAGLTIWLLFAWVKAEWHAGAYIVIPRLILVLIGLTIAANTFTSGAIWDGSFLPADPPAADQPSPTDQATKHKPAEETPAADAGPGLSGTLWASAFSLFLLSLAASRYCAWQMFNTQKFLDHPLRVLRGAKGKFYDARRVH